MKRYKVTQIMNTKQLGLILVTGFFLSSTASALNLNPRAAVADDPLTGDDETIAAITEGTVVIATEIKASDLTVGGVTEDPEGLYEVIGQSGFIIPVGAGYFARFELGGGATFASDLVEDSVEGVTIAADGQVSTSGNGLGDQFEVAAGGADGDDYAVVSVGQNDGLISLGTLWRLKDVMFDISGKEDVTFTYSLHENAGDAVNDQDPLNTQSGMLIEFKAATAMSGGPADNAKLIDVASSGLLFEGSGKVTTIMEISLKTVVGAINPVDDGEDPTFDNIAKSVDFTVGGNFGAINLGDADADPVVAAAGKVWLDKSPECIIDTPAVVADSNADPMIEAMDSVSGGSNLGLLKITGRGQVSAEVELPRDGFTFADYATAYLCMETDGKTEIPEGGYTGKLEMNANTGFDPHPDVSNIKGNVLAKNADSAEVHLLLTPNGVYRNYVRLSNTSSVPVDNLRVTLYNDEGGSKSFKLSDVEGVSSNELAPYASTSLINIDVLYAAAQAAELDEDEEMFTVTGGDFGNKLRARVDGSFQKGTVDIQSLSVSIDNNSFFTF